MKALSLRQPWLWAVLELGKTIENRRWNTKLRGPILLHAAKGCSVQECAEAIDWMTDRKLLNWWNDTRWPGLDKLERGGICGYAEIADVQLPNLVGDRWKMHGQWGFVLRNVRRLPFVPCKGALGFWEVPSEIARAVVGIMNGLCACQSDVLDPGPTHLPSCRFADPNYDDGGFP